MAISIRGTTPATTSGIGVLSLTLTGARQPQAGDVLVIIHGNDFFQLSNMSTPTVAGSTTGVNPISGGSADGGTNFAHVKTYTYVAGSTGDLTVAAVETGLADEEKCLIVYVLSGVDTSAPVDVAGGNFNSGAGNQTHDAPSISPTSPDAFLICHSNDGAGSDGGTSTPPSGMAEQYDASQGGVMSFTGATLQLSASGATGTKTFTSTANSQWATVSIAVKSAAADSTSGESSSSVRLPRGVVLELRARTRPRPATSSLGAQVDLDGSITATAAPDGTATVNHPVDGAITATAAITGTATVTHPVDGAQTGTATLAGTATVTHPLSGTITAAAAHSTTATVTHPLSGSVSASATVAGTAQVVHPVDGTLTVTAGQTGAIDVVTPGAANVDGTRTATATITGALALTHTIDGALVATAARAGTLNLVSVLAGARQTQAGIVAALDVAAAFTPILIGLDGGSTTTGLDGQATQPTGLDGGTTTTGGIS